MRMSIEMSAFPQTKGTGMTIYRWNKTHETYYLDIKGWGRYSIGREGSRIFRAFLNGKRTTYAGSLKDVMSSVERSVRAGYDIEAKFIREEN